MIPKSGPDRDGQSFGISRTVAMSRNHRLDTSINFLERRIVLARSGARIFV